jgi:CRP-like cAMP-binding protein
MFERFRQVQLFAELSDDDLGRICAEAIDVSLAPGDVLFREGDPGDRAFLVSSGEVEILRTTERREVLIAVRTADEVIGEMALLDEQPRSATARARSATELVSIPKATLEDLLATSPSTVPVERCRSAVEAALGAEDFAGATEQGRAMTADQAVAFALQ